MMLSSKRLETYFTCVWLNSRVNSQVAFQILIRKISFATQVTFPHFVAYLHCVFSYEYSSNISIKEPFGEIHSYTVLFHYEFLHSTHFCTNDLWHISHFVHGFTKEWVLIWTSNDTHRCKYLGAWTIFVWFIFLDDVKFHHGHPSL